jgi:hypothetical protein
MRISLAGNFITSLHGCTFTDSAEMAPELDLRDNLISKFEDLNVVALPKWLTRINLERNPISDGLSADGLEELHRKVLYRIMKDRNRAKRPIPSPPPASAPPLEPGELSVEGPINTNSNVFNGDFNGGSKLTTKKIRKSARKLKRKNQKTNKRRISKNKSKKIN